MSAEKCEVVIAGAQYAVVSGDKAANYNKMEKMARKAKKEYGADLLLFPECALTGSISTREELLSMGEPLNGEYIRKFRALSTELDMDLGIPFDEICGDKCYCSMVLCEPDGNFGYYRKVHLPDMGSSALVEHGDRFVVMETRFGKIGMQICYDARFPEQARAMALDGARLILSPSCQIGDGADRVRKMLVRARALENRVFMLYTNWVGDGFGMHFPGGSHICDILGNVIQEADDRECIIAQKVDLAQADRKAIIRPEQKVYIFEDRQPQLYGRLMSR